MRIHRSSKGPSVRNRALKSATSDLNRMPMYVCTKGCRTFWRAFANPGFIPQCREHQQECPGLFPEWFYDSGLLGSRISQFVFDAERKSARPVLMGRTVRASTRAPANKPPPKRKLALCRHKWCGPGQTSNRYAGPVPRLTLQNHSWSTGTNFKWRAQRETSKAAPNPCQASWRVPVTILSTFWTEPFTGTGLLDSTRFEANGPQCGLFWTRTLLSPCILDMHLLHVWCLRQPKSQL